MDFVKVQAMLAGMYFFQCYFHMLTRKLYNLPREMAFGNTILTMIHDRVLAGFIRHLRFGNLPIKINSP